MTDVLRRPVFWLAVLGSIVAMALGIALTQAQKATVTSAPAAPAQSPFAAVSAGKADVEGGIIQVASRTAGVVQEVRVIEGDHVKKGEVLARQQDDAPRLAVATAEANLAQAKAQLGTTQVQITAARRELARLQALGDVVSRQQVDQAHDTVDSAEAVLASEQATIAVQAATLGEARYRLEETIIRAPADGVIVRRYANPGTGASTLNVTPMFDLEPAGQRIVRAEVTETELPSVSLGQRVLLSPEADQSHVYPGKVLREAGLFGARKLQSDDPSERTDERVVEVVVSADSAPFLVGQRVLVKFLKPGS
ncbi:MAG TPA: HlyD family efflux transporter periplasmic adaptor subunit [Caulobacteraceae bacterium]|jgi:RND family efflux transporter MFP subunit|nr:HlyD family efflux transporter periplasmic adaptor subunit [Caulobacteraceae bacterium]